MCFVSSCTLDRVSYTEIYPEKFFQNEGDIEAALTALYNPFSSDWGKLYTAAPESYFSSSEFSTDILKATWTRYNHFYEHWWTVDGTDRASSFSQNLYGQYNFLSRIKSTMFKIEDSSVSLKVKTRALAEAKCLYGWMGIIMYDIFGPVPLASDEAIRNPQNTDVPARLSDEEYSKIMEDMLIDAAKGLPEVQQEWGRVTKGMARMLLLKLHMINRNFEKAEIVARELYEMEGKYYELFDKGYANIFSKSYTKNKEIIYAIPCGVGMPNLWHSEVLPTDYPYSGSIDKWSGYRMDWRFFDTFEPNDERLETIVSQYINTDGELIKRGTGTLSAGALPLKYGEDPAAVGGAMTIDFIVYRYADVLLSLAECINENNDGPNDEAIGLVNRVRNRVGLKNLKSAQTADKEAFNKAILEERGHEFYAEGLRRQDLIRHGKFISTSLELYPNSQSAAHKVRFPIPTKYITESKGVVKQNEGYN